MMRKATGNIRDTRAAGRRTSRTKISARGARRLRSADRLRPRHAPNCDFPCAAPSPPRCYTSSVSWPEAPRPLCQRAGGPVRRGAPCQGAAHMVARCGCDRGPRPLLQQGALQCQAAQSGATAAQGVLQPRGQAPRPGVSRGGVGGGRARGSDGCWPRRCPPHPKPRPPEDAGEHTTPAPPLLGRLGGRGGRHGLGRGRPPQQAARQTKQSKAQQSKQGGVSRKLRSSVACAARGKASGGNVVPRGLPEGPREGGREGGGDG